MRSIFVSLTQLHRSQMHEYPWAGFVYSAFAMLWTMVQVRSLGAKNRRFNSITKRWTCWSSFDVQKNYVWVCSMSNSTHLEMGRSMFDVRLFEIKTRIFKFDYQKMNMFKSLHRSKKCLSSFLCLVKLSWLNTKLDPPLFSALVMTISNQIFIIAY